MPTDNVSDFNLLKETRELLSKRPINITLPVISKETGLGMHWLAKFSYNKEVEPGINKVQKLYDYLKSVA